MTNPVWLRDRREEVLLILHEDSAGSLQFFFDVEEQASKLGYTEEEMKAIINSLEVHGLIRVTARAVNEAPTVFCLTRKGIIRAEGIDETNYVLDEMGARDVSAPTRPQMGHHVFISYSREDQPYARQLADDLRRLGVEVWLDDRIDFGDRWWQTIVEFIRTCEAFVVVMTPESEKSEWVEREILVAQRKKKPIFPLLLRGEGHTLLITSQYADVTGGRMPPKAFYDRLQRALPIAEQVTERAEKEPPPKPDRAVPSLPSTYTNSIGMEFVLIPAGTYKMGSNNGDSSERPMHTVEITKPFYLGKYPVTQVEWEAFVGKNPSCFEGANRPVERLSWDDAQEFMRKLHEKEGGSRYRIPTEAEWEYACRAGEGESYERALDAVAWYRGNSGDETHPVGRKRPNAWGLYDMLGNVWEWVQDWYDGDYYERSPRLDPQGPDLEKKRVLRGGAFDHDRYLARCAARYGLSPANRSRSLGFRLVLLPSSGPVTL